MPEIARPWHGYRSDSTVPRFDDSKPLFVFDGVCVLCSTGASWIMRHDKHAQINLTSAQSPLGQALYRHFGLSIDGSYLLIHGGRAFTATRGYLQLCTIFGGLWRVFLIGKVIPESWRDRAYDVIARNRYRWFGKADYCALLTEEQRRRLL